jgi:hypothetical protein
MRLARQPRDLSGFFQRIKQAQMRFSTVDIQSGSVFPTGMLTDTALPRRIVAAQTSILVLLRFGRFPEVTEAVVASVAIGMIDQARTPFAINHKPDEEVLPIGSAIHTNP